MVEVRLQVTAGVTQRPGDLGPQHLGVSAPMMGLGGRSEKSVQDDNELLSLREEKTHVLELILLSQ